jgi:predicted DNA-binding transcriptional regulator AlpA
MHVRQPIEGHLSSPLQAQRIGYEAVPLHHIEAVEQAASPFPAPALSNTGANAESIGIESRAGRANDLRGTGTRAQTERQVILSDWMNERLPALDEILSAHDVARLTRRRSWVIRALMLLGNFPRKHRFHGRAIGWAKRDVLTWLATQAAGRRNSAMRRALGPSEWVQASLPMHLPRTRRWRSSCVTRRKGDQT